MKPLIQTLTIIILNCWLTSVSFGQVQFTPDGTKAFIIAADIKLKLWDLKTGEILQSFPSQTKVFLQPSNGKFFLSLNNRGFHNYHLWEIATGKLIKTFKSPMSAIYTPGSDKVCLRQTDKYAEIWDIAQGKKLQEIREKDVKALSPDGKRYVTVKFHYISNKNAYELKVWNTTTNQLLYALPIVNTRYWNIEFSVNGKHLIADHYEEGFINRHWWNATNGKLEKVIKKHNRWVAPNGNSRITKVKSTPNDTIKLWNLQTKKVLKTFIGKSKQKFVSEYSKDSQRVIIGYRKKEIQLCDASTGKTLLRLYPKKEWHYIDFNFSPNQRFVMGNFQDANLNKKITKIWDANTGQLIFESSVGLGVVFSPDNTKIITGNYRGKLQLWSLVTGKLIKTLPRSRRAYEQAFFSPDGKKIITTNREQPSKIWEANSGKLLYTLF